MRRFGCARQQWDHLFRENWTSLSFVVSDDPKKGAEFKWPAFTTRASKTSARHWLAPCVFWGCCRGPYNETKKKRLKYNKRSKTFRSDEVLDKSTTSLFCCSKIAGGLPPLSSTVTTTKKTGQLSLVFCFLWWPAGFGGGILPWRIPIGEE